MAESSQVRESPAPETAPSPSNEQKDNSDQQSSLPELNFDDGKESRKVLKSLKVTYLSYRGYDQPSVACSSKCTRSRTRRS